MIDGRLIIVEWEVTRKLKNVSYWAEINTFTFDWIGNRAHNFSHAIRKTFLEFKLEFSFLTNRGHVLSWWFVIRLILAADLIKSKL